MEKINLTNLSEIRIPLSEEEGYLVLKDVEITDKDVIVLSYYYNDVVIQKVPIEKKLIPYYNEGSMKVIDLLDKISLKRKCEIAPYLRENYTIEDFNSISKIGEFALTEVTHSTEDLFTVVLTYSNEYSCTINLTAQMVAIDGSINDLSNILGDYLTLELERAKKHKEKQELFQKEIQNILKYTYSVCLFQNSFTGSIRFYIRRTNLSGVGDTDYHKTTFLDLNKYFEEEIDKSVSPYFESVFLFPENNVRVDRYDSSLFLKSKDPGEINYRLFKTNNSPFATKVRMTSICLRIMESLTDLNKRIVDVTNISEKYWGDMNEEFGYQLSIPSCYYLEEDFRQIIKGNKGEKY